MSFGEFTDDMFGVTPIQLTKIILKVWLILSIIGTTMGTVYALYVNDIPRTHNGHIIYVSHRYNKFYDYEWTDVEILTYSGDSHHVYFWGHPELKLQTNYHVHTVIKPRFFLLPLPAWESKELITELETIDS